MQVVLALAATGDLSAAHQYAQAYGLSMDSLDFSSEALAADVEKCVLLWQPVAIQLACFFHEQLAIAVSMAGLSCTVLAGYLVHICSRSG